MNKKLIATVVYATVLGLSNYANARTIDSKETIYQPALLQSLTLGYYDGFVTVKDFKKLGDTGIGTFHGVNGELIALNGQVYQALGNGRVIEADSKETIPFGNITHFDEDFSEEITDVKNINSLKAIVDKSVEKHGKNYFYMAKISGKFNKVLVRSEHKQYPPYKTLAKALAKDQTEFTYDNLSGTMVALYCPAFVKGVNTPGWHFHFISDDREKGGHVLAVDIKKAIISYDLTRNYHILLPEDNVFNELNLELDQSKDIQKVEQADKKNLSSKNTLSSKTSLSYMLPATLAVEM